MFYVMRKPYFCLLFDPYFSKELNSFQYTFLGCQLYYELSLSDFRKKKTSPCPFPTTESGEDKL